MVNEQDLLKQIMINSPSINEEDFLNAEIHNNDNNHPGLNPDFNSLSNEHPHGHNLVDDGNNQRQRMSHSARNRFDDKFGKVHVYL